MIADDDDPEARRHGDQRLADDLARDDRVARHRRDEDLLAEVLLAVGEQRHEPEHRRLPDRLGQDAGEHEEGEVDPARRAEARLERRTEDEDEDQRERELRDEPHPVAQELDEVAVRDDRDRGQVRAPATAGGVPARTPGAASRGRAPSASAIGRALPVARRRHRQAVPGPRRRAPRGSRSRGTRPPATARASGRA